MTIKDGQRIEYIRNPIIEAVCQLRFPVILAIGAREPVQFQECIRETFPRYAQRLEKIPNSTMAVTNHTFLSENGLVKLCLTSHFIALSVVKYSSWKTFAGWLDEPLTHFISIYRPAYFERVGLRYINGISRELLSLEDVPWKELIVPKYLGVLADEASNESSIHKFSLDTEMKLEQNVSARIHAGLGLIQRSVNSEGGIRKVRENNPRFILDLDLFSLGKTPLQSAATTLDTIHDYADRFFSEAITDKLHNAMEPVYI